MKKFKQHAIGEESDMKEHLETLKKEFKMKFEKFREDNEEKIKVFFFVFEL